MDTIGGNDEPFDCDINKTEEQPQSMFQESMLEDECTTDEITRKRKRKIKTVGIKKQKIEIECSICLSNVRGKKIANPSGCKHNFCVNCLKKWAKQNFTCPFDRIKFDFINIIDKCTNEILEKIDPKGKPYVQPIETSNAATNHVNNFFANRAVNNVVNPVQRATPTPRELHVNNFVISNAVDNIVNPVRQNVQPLSQATPASRELRNGYNCFICECSNYQNLMVECDACNKRFHVGCLPNIEEITISQWSCFMCQTLKRPIDHSNRNGVTRNIALQRYRIHQQIINNNNRTPNNNNNRTPNDNINNRTPNDNINNRTPSDDNNNRASNNNNRAVRPLPSRPRNIQPPQPNPQAASKPESHNLLLDILRSQNELFGSKAPSNNVPKVSNKVATNVISHSGNPPNANSFDARDPNSRVSLVSKVAKDILKQNKNRVTNEKAREILKIVVPKLVKEINLSTSLDRLREMAEEKIFTWMDIL